MKQKQWSLLPRLREVLGYTAAKSAILGTRLTSGIRILNGRIRPMASIRFHDPVRLKDQLRMLCALNITNKVKHKDHTWLLHTPV